MSSLLDPDNPYLRRELYRLFRDYFRRAERKRRWSLDEDIPWSEANGSLPPEFADVLETFCAVELYLPDYVGKALPLIRQNRGWTWIHLNWGYEEAKHSMAMQDWLLRSGHRTEEQMDDLEDHVFEKEWDFPVKTAPGMLVYAMAQELATWLHYKRLFDQIGLAGGDPALTKMLKLIIVDERAHHAFYFGIVEMFLEIDREQTLELLREVLHNFHMPAVHLLADCKARENRIRSMNIFDEEVFFKEVYQPILERLGITRKEMRRSGVAKK